VQCKKKRQHRPRSQNHPQKKAAILPIQSVSECGPPEKEGSTSENAYQMQCLLMSINKLFFNREQVNFYMMHVPVYVPSKHGKCKLDRWGLGNVQHCERAFIQYGRDDVVKPDELPATPFKCSHCKVTLHSECYIKYHQLQNMYHNCPDYRSEFPMTDAEKEDAEAKMISI